VPSAGRTALDRARRSFPPATSADEITAGEWMLAPYYDWLPPKKTSRLRLWVLLPSDDSFPHRRWLLKQPNLGHSGDPVDEPRTLMFRCSGSTGAISAVVIQGSPVGLVTADSSSRAPRGRLIQGLTSSGGSIHSSTPHRRRWARLSNHSQFQSAASSGADVGRGFNARQVPSRA